MTDVLRVLSAWIGSMLFSVAAHVLVIVAAVLLGPPAVLSGEAFGRWLDRRRESVRSCNSGSTRRGGPRRRLLGSHPGSGVVEGHGRG